MKNIEVSLFDAINAGKILLQEYKDKSEDEKIYVALVSLFHIESVLDKGRILLDETTPQIFDEINKGMDQIRDGISLLVAKLPRENVVNTLRSEGENFKTGFIPRL
jgi:hypothetical protein